MESRIQRKTQIHPTDAAAWISDPINSPEDDDEKQPTAGSFRCLLRVIQFGFIFLLLYASFTLVNILFSVHVIRFKVSPAVERAPIIPPVKRSILQDPPLSTLLDIHNFTLLHKPDNNLCSVDNLLFVMIVHSKPDHFQQRQIIRSTWGSLRVLPDLKENYKWTTRTFFVLGESLLDEEFQPKAFQDKVRQLIEEESEQMQDIVLGSFHDNYHNLRYKHVLGLRYAADHCSNAIFFIKADDDVFIDLPGLYQYLVRTFGSINRGMKDILAGNVFPSGTSPQRKGKWAVNTSEYPWYEYPSYLGGLAYLMTPDVARDLYRIAHSSQIPEIWVDDVWITGLLAYTLRIQPLYLNPRYSYDHDEMEEWLEESLSKARPIHHPPYTFAHLDLSRKDWKAFSQRLWDEVLTFYNLTDHEHQREEKGHHSNIIRDVIR